MRIALGIHVGHDRGACLIKNKEVIGVISQERLDRKKHSRSAAIPYQAIDALLQYCKIDITDIACVGLSYDGVDGDTILDLYKKEFFAYYNCSPVPFVIVNHHDAHAYSTYYTSGLQKALILVCDGGGDYHGDRQEAESLYVGCGGTLQRISARYQDPPIRRIGDDLNYIYPQMPEVVKQHQISIGRKYEQVTHLLGFGWGESGKTMGLASYGKPLIDYSALDIKSLDFSLKYGDILDVIFAKQVLSGLSWEEYIKVNAADIASTVQHYTEMALSSLVKNLSLMYGCNSICLAGGVFLNCLTNQRIISNSAVADVFVLPSAGDDGQALGCAYYAYSKYVEESKNFSVDIPYLGLSYANNEVEKTLLCKSLPYKKLEDDELAQQIAQSLASNMIVAIHRGRTEIGPRALCHRSILANPANPAMKDILNARVKHREAFRPFAPTVIDEDQYKLFRLVAPSYYMLVATEVSPEYQKQLPSITHVDGTARIQVVSEKNEPFIHNVLTKLKKLTGHGVMINTSFNIAGEPIVEKPEDAINTFLRTNIDCLAIGNFWIEKKPYN